MKAPEEIANHPKARLHRELVARLRASGSIRGAKQTWTVLKLNQRLWKRIVNYGLDRPERQLQLNTIAFPDSNWTEVDAALRAGNKLNRLYELARGSASIVRDSARNYKIGIYGLKIVKHASTTPGHATPSRK
jgi:hypothetical protein